LQYFLVFLKIDYLLFYTREKIYELVAVLYTYLLYNLHQFDNTDMVIISRKLFKGDPIRNVKRRFRLRFRFVKRPFHVPVKVACGPDTF
jgi:hypothetical protein